MSNDIPPIEVPDPRTFRIDQMNRENQEAVLELARRGTGVHPVTFVDAKIAALMVILGEIFGEDYPDLGLRVQLRYCEILKTALDAQLKQSLIAQPGSVPPLLGPNGHPGR